MNGRISVLCLTAMIAISLSGCNKEAEKTKDVTLLTTTTVVAEIGGQHAAGGAWGSQPVTNTPQVEFSNSGRGFFYTAEEAGKFHVVHNGKKGTPYTNILTPTLSPDGQHLAYQAYVEDKVRMVVDGREEYVADELEVPFFSPDSRHIAYQAKFGGRWHFVVDGRTFPGNKTQHNQFGFSADSSRIAYVDSADEGAKPRLVVSDLSFKSQTVRQATGAVMVISDDKTRIAATSEAGGKQRVIEFGFADPGKVKEGALYDGIKQLVISADGSSVAYIAERGEARLLVWNGQEKPFPDGELVGTIVFRPDHKGVGFLTTSNGTCTLHQPFSSDAPEKRNFDEVGELTYSKDGSAHVYLARKEIPGKKGRSIFLVVNGKEGSKFDKIIKPTFSPDGQRVVYRVRQDGKRFMAVSDLNGKVVRQDPEYEMVFPPVFSGDGKVLAYGVKDGAKLVWQVEKL